MYDNLGVEGDVYADIYVLGRYPHSLFLFIFLLED